MLVAVLAGFVAAPAAPFLHRHARGLAGWLLALLPLGLLIYFAGMIGPVSRGQALGFSYPWVPSLGVGLDFRIDGLSLLFSLLVCGVGALVLVYAGGYLAGDGQQGRLFAMLLLFMAAMLGVVTSDSLIGLYVFWELTTVSSYLLIGYKHEEEKARKAALQGLLVTGAGGLALLAGLILLGAAAGTQQISELLSRGDQVRAHPLYPAILALVLIGAFTKSAQVPFHFWLPGAMAAPTPVSAYLHSATMVKAGVFLLARLNPALGGTEAWQMALTITGGATGLIGAFLAAQQTDLKRILAYTTVSALGTLVALIGIGTDDALKAAAVFLLGHALYKGALFMVAGTVEHETGTRDVRELGGLWRAMPITAVAAGLAALSMAGLPPFFGFIAKEVLYKAKLEEPPLIIAAVLTNVFVVVAAGLVFWRAFFGSRGAAAARAHEGPTSMVAGPLLLAAAGLLVGVFSAPIGDILVGPAVSAVIGETQQVELLLWTGIEGAAGQAIALSALTLALGGLLYARRGWLERTSVALAPAYARGPESWYQRGLDGLLGLAAWQTRVLQNGYLRAYLALAIGTLLLLAGTAIARGGVAPSVPAGWQDVRFYELLLAAIMVAAAVAVVRARSRLAALVAIGAIGYGMALTFLLYGGPDLAMTQFAIETLSVILFVLVIYRLPRFNLRSDNQPRLWTLSLALGGGALMTTLTLAALGVPGDSLLTPYFAESSAPLAFGRNIVNVILVDFRGVDTLGEITVLGMAAVGIYALMTMRPADEPPADATRE
jgi:multicomponent Na+:H+ antiporter subunit A